MRRGGVGRNSDEDARSASAENGNLWRRSEEACPVIELWSVARNDVTGLSSDTATTALCTAFCACVALRSQRTTYRRPDMHGMLREGVREQGVHCMKSVIDRQSAARSDCAVSPAEIQTADNHSLAGRLHHGGNLHRCCSEFDRPLPIARFRPTSIMQRQHFLHR